MTVPVARVRFGLNRRARVEVRIAAWGSGPIAASWNGAAARREGSGVLELSAAPTRGVNTVEIEAPPGTVVAPLELAATACDDRPVTRARRTDAGGGRAR